MTVESIIPKRRPQRVRAPEALPGVRHVPFKVENQPSHLRESIPKMLAEIIASYDKDRTQVIDLAPLVEQAGNSLKTDPQIVNQLRQLRRLIQQWQDDASAVRVQYMSKINMEHAPAIFQAEEHLLKMIDLVAGPEPQSRQRVSEIAPTEFIRRPGQIRPVLRPRELPKSPTQLPGENVQAFRIPKEQASLPKPAAETSMLETRKKVEEAPKRIDQALTQIEDALEQNELLRIPDLVQILVTYEKYIDDLFFKPRIQKVVARFTAVVATETLEPKTQRIFEALRFLDQLAGRPETGLAKPKSTFERSLQWLKRLFQ